MQCFQFLISIAFCQVQAAEVSYKSLYENNISATVGEVLDVADMNFDANNTNFTPSYPGAFTVSIGGEHICAVEHDGGEVKCWGQGEFGQLGDGRSTKSHVPVQVAGLGPSIAVSAGGLHSCAVELTGTVKCWGQGQYGQLGHGGLSQRADARAVPFLTPSVNVTTGGSHSCALERSGSVKCWGWGQYGQLGNGQVKDSRYPVQVMNLEKVVSLSAGALHTCAVEQAGGVKCWGWAKLGQLGNTGVSGEISSSPVLVDGVQNAKEVACGYQHSCALLRNESVLTTVCWGDGMKGQLQTTDEIWAKTVRRVLRLNEILALSDPIPTAPIRSIW